MHNATTPQELDGGHIPEENTKDMLDPTDKALLSIIQSGFPLAKRPYKVLGEALGIAEEEALERVRNLRAQRVIRRIGANFQSAAIGFKSTLCAASVPQEKLELFIENVNKRPGVTHNYLRDHPIYNVWFTLISQSPEHMRAELTEIEQQTGIKILNLPATELYKIKVDFNLQS